MFTRQQREAFDQPTDQAGFTVANGAMVLLYPVAPGEDDNFSRYLTPDVRHHVTMTGERLDLRWTIKPTKSKIELVRKPSASATKLEGMSLLPDVAGVYVVRAWLGPWSREITIAAWPGKELTRMGKPAAPGKPDTFWIERRKRLQMLTNDPAVTAAKLIESLEVNADGTFGFGGAMGVTVAVNGW